MDSQNSKIQYDEPKRKKLLVWDENYNSAFSRSLLRIFIQNFKIQYGGPKITWFRWKSVLESRKSQLNFTTVDSYLVHGHKHLCKHLFNIFYIRIWIFKSRVGIPSQRPRKYIFILIKIILHFEPPFWIHKFLRKIRNKQCQKFPTTNIDQYQVTFVFWTAIVTAPF